MSNARLPKRPVKEVQTSGTYGEIRVRTERSRNNRPKECANESLEHDDELVKYMSKLPGYLLRVERGEECVQSNNVLNVGVLDWERLEKWKHGRARGGDRSRKRETKVSTNDATTSGVVPNESKRCEIDHQLPTCSNFGEVRASRDLKHSVHGVRCSLEPECICRDSLNKQDIATSSNKSSSRDLKGVEQRKIRRHQSNRESSSGLSSDMGNSYGSLGMNKNLVVRDKKTQKGEGDIHTQEPRERATESGNHCVEKLDGEEKIIGYSKASEKQEFSNIFLLRSRKQSRSSLPREHQISLDDKARVSREVNHSLDHSNEIKSSFGLRSHVPRSSPFSFDLEGYSEDMMLPLCADISGKKEQFGVRRHSKTASRIFDQELREDESRMERNHSPNKRFSFSFGRLSKSFRVKEDSADQPLNSSEDTIKSSSMRFEGSNFPSQSSNPENQNPHCRSRVSSLRRFLDPLLKTKGTENVCPSKATSNPMPTNSDIPLQDEKKQDTARTGALFQLTIRNGIPLFQFVVDDNNNTSSRSILGATMKSKDSSFKDDSVQYCTFYSVNEVTKKKSASWLIHGHKEKHNGFIYNVIGQMRLGNSMTADITEQKSEIASPMIIESVLFDKSEQEKGRSEIAAVVIKKMPLEENYYTGVEETILIIPEDVHSLPEKGAPTPLLSRWRSGGLCDCGGWDVGCKLQVISSKSVLHGLNQSFELFDQERSGPELGPALAMSEVETGIYRVEFCSLVSPLQAFFVCVTVITCAFEANITGKSTSPMAPPLSPVGRV